ncbi:MAG: alpha/beta fold hydrolase [Aureliella sp.]
MHRISILGPKGHSFSVVTAGEGPVVFLLHGFPLDHRLWESQLSSLSSEYRIVCPEFRGFGATPISEDETYSLGDLADDVELLRRHLAANERITLVGLSMGGYVALEYWSRYAEHLSGLVLTNTKPNADDAAAKQGRLAMADEVLRTNRNDVVRGMLDKLLPTDVARDTRVQAERMMLDTSPRAIAVAQRAMAGRRDFTEQLDEIDIPTLVLTGEMDQLAPVDSTRDWAAHIPGARFVSIGQCGHLSPLERPQEFNAALTQFLN